jgi:chemotaxis response regulator CheB
MTALLKPDVITCDLNMPEMDGVSFVREQMAKRPVPIVIISVANPSGEQVLAALEAGAVDFLQKPTALATDRCSTSPTSWSRRSRAAAGAHVAQSRRPPPRSDGTAVSAVRHADRHLVIGISTGGPQALKVSFRSCRPTFRAGGDGAAHADRLHRAVREEARRALAVTVKEAVKARSSSRARSIWLRPDAISRSGAPAPGRRAS